MINKVKKIIKISKLEAHLKTPPETSVSTPWGILFGNMCGYNTINHYQPLFCVNDHCVKYSEVKVN
jgi:hypothetical protein